MKTLAHRPSIRTQLLFWLLIPILVLLLVGLALTYGLASQLSAEAFDKALLDNLYSVARCLQIKDGKVIVDMPPAALAILREDTSDKVYYEVLDSNLRKIAGDKDIPPMNYSSTMEDNLPRFRDATISGEYVRIATIRMPVGLNEKAHAYIRVAQTMHQREQIADEILISVVLPQLAIVLLSALLVWLGVRRGLAPLHALRDAVASKSVVDLRPIAVESVPKEVHPLVHAINALLYRLQQDIQAQRRFVANAAHQLRTPIAGLKTQTELALRQTTPEDIQHALALIHTSAERSTRLATQLLSLARAEPGARDRQSFSPLDLNSICRNACRELVPEAISRDIDLGFEESPVPAVVLGDEASLHELAGNLIHNSVLYTQGGGTVTVRIDALEGTDCEVALVVIDNGPGIPTEERERVFERFYRLIDHRVSGSGLGLAIVREIANLHEAKVVISDGPGGIGTCVRVCFKQLHRALNDEASLDFSPGTPQKFDVFRPANVQRGTTSRL